MSGLFTSLEHRSQLSEPLHRKENIAACASPSVQGAERSSGFQLSSGNRESKLGSWHNLYEYSQVALSQLSDLTALNWVLAVALPSALVLEFQLVWDLAGHGFSVRLLMAPPTMGVH